MGQGWSHRARSTPCGPRTRQSSPSSSRCCRTGCTGWRMRSAGTVHLAEDAVQSALVSAYRTWPRVRDADSPEAYLRTMVVNQLLSWRRRKSWARTTSPSGGAVEPSRASHEDEDVEQQRMWSAVGRAAAAATRGDRAALLRGHVGGRHRRDPRHPARNGQVAGVGGDGATARPRWPTPRPRRWPAGDTRRGRGEMTLEERVASAVRAQTDLLPPDHPRPAGDPGVGEEADAPPRVDRRRLRGRRARGGGDRGCHRRRSGPGHGHRADRHTVPQPDDVHGARTDGRGWVDHLHVRPVRLPGRSPGRLDRGPCQPEVGLRDRRGGCAQPRARRLHRSRTGRSA